jgi:glycosyltransferase involved in cell wall biosynthesis
MPGYIHSPFKIMRKASVFVLSSKREALPTVIIEAMACGCPVVSTNCKSGPSEILENGRYGYLVPVGDHQAMAEAIINTLNNPMPAKILIDRAKHFSIDKSISKYINILDL